MHHARSRTKSREESLKRRQLEARRVPPLRFEQDGGLHTYRVHRPSRGRDVYPAARPSTASPQRPEVETAQSAWAAAVRPTTPPPSATAEPRARPVVAPVYPLARAHGSEQNLRAITS